ncbi:MAG TPA: hypothetical protein VMT91_00645 [Anaerolineales bacterium]|nr:hypothetical protein [Anaerolineales bacterium]
MAEKATPFVSTGREAYFPKTDSLVCLLNGWVAFAWRDVQVWSKKFGFLVRVEGGRDFYIRSDGDEIRWVGDTQSGIGLSETERQILLGPVIVLALALRGVLSLHASAAIFRGKLVLFLGESGQGKSTLAAYLSGQPGWRLAADDILPVTEGVDGLTAWPHFPQLKLPKEAQPGPGLPEQIAVHAVVMLTEADSDGDPNLKILPASQAVQAYLGHTAGTRLFGPKQLADHLAFCANAAGQTPTYRLIYPHRRETLPQVRELLESLC